jgi:hypothetical protein
MVENLIWKAEFEFCQAGLGCAQNLDYIYYLHLLPSSTTSIYYLHLLPPSTTSIYYLHLLPPSTTSIYYLHLLAR